MPVQEKPQFSHHFSTHSSEVSLQQVEFLAEATPEQKEGEKEKNDHANSSPEMTVSSENNNANPELSSEVQLNESVSSKTGEEPAESEDEESDEEKEEKEEKLLPYSIALLHQVLAFLISITNPSKYILIYPL